MYRVMIVGCGAIAPAHIQGFLKQPKRCKVTVLCNRHVDKAETLKKQHGLLDAKVVADYHKELHNVDIVAVCSPPKTHCEISVKALNSGCHVLLEKPMAPTLTECDEIINAAKKSGKTLCVVSQSWFVSSVRNLIKMISDGSYGKILYSRVNSNWYRGQSYYALKWRGRWLNEGGGCTLNHSIHHIDLLLKAKGMPQNVTSFMTNLNHKNSEEEDFSSSLLQYADGTVAEITSNLISHGEDANLVFQCEQAGFKIPFDVQISKPHENGFPVKDKAAESAVICDFQSRKKLEFEHHDGQIKYFLDTCDGMCEPQTSGEQARAAIELILGIYKSSLVRKTVNFPLKKDDLFYGNDWRRDATHFHEKYSDIESFYDTKITDFQGKYE